MKTIILKNVSKSLAQKTLFTSVSFVIAQHERVAIIGNNGTGKSTLLKIMAGLEPADEGQVNINESAAYVGQEFNGNRMLSIAEYLSQQKATARIHAIIKKFGVISPQLLEKGNLSELSGGQLRVLEIAAVLSRGPMFLCIDEPENHLDIKVRHILTDLLRDYWGAVIMVSHDHTLINSLTKKIVLIEHETVSVTNDLTYEELVEVRLKRKDLMRHDYQVAKQKLTKMTNLVTELRRQTTFSDSKAKTYQMKKRQLAKERKLVETMARPDNHQLKIQAGEVEQKQGKLIVQLNEVSCGYDTIRLFSKVSLDIRFGQKLCLLGRNGTGKTTLLKLITGAIEPQAGEMRRGVNINTVVFSQHSELPRQSTAFELFATINISKDSAWSILTHLLFTKEEMNMATECLSGGQKQRLRLALMFYAKPDFVILDEPTNNLDPVNWQFLVELVREFEGTVLFVTHDKSFLEAINDLIILVVAKNTLTRVWGSIDDAISLL
jgi:ATPase subunit of ABC transporter with duplicated ATPase domains